MNTEYLESFVKVVECESIAEAARRLNITAGAVAARIHSLEKQLATELLQRSGQTVRPTAAGLRVYEKAKMLVLDMRDLYAVAGADTLAGEFRLGVFPSAAITHLPLLMEAFFHQAPALSSSITIDVSAELYRQVESGELDCALAIEQPFAAGKACGWKTLQEEPLIAIVPAGMEVEGRHVHDILQNEPFIRYARAVHSGKLVDRYLKDHRIVPRQRLEIDSLLTIVSMVARGVGVAVVPDSYSIACQSPALVRLALPERVPVRRIGMIWAAQGPRLDIARDLVAHAQTVFN